MASEGIAGRLASAPGLKSLPGLQSPSGPASPPPGLGVMRPRRQGTAAWPLVDRAAYWLCWTAGLALCLIAVAIVLYMLIEGLSYLRPHLLVTSPAPSLQQSKAGGFLDPIEGTFLLTAVGIAIAAPIGVGLAIWLSEYGRPAHLARAVESAVEMLAGAPSVVLAIFGVLLFGQGVLGFLSQHTAGGAVTGKSFLTAGAIMSIIALPLVVGATREGLASVPNHMREASHALGKTRATTIRRVLLPSVRLNIVEGTVLGIGRIIGDTAIVLIVLGATLKTEPVNGVPILGLLRGTGTTLSYYVYYNSPAGEGNAHQKAYAAAFVLLIIVLALNFAVTRLAGRRERLEARGRRRRLRAWWPRWSE
jgi:phosphate transport system permease protein